MNTSSFRINPIYMDTLSVPNITCLDTMGRLVPTQMYGLQDTPFVVVNVHPNTRQLEFDFAKEFQLPTISLIFP